jgi:hypothetical protein
MTLVGNIMGKRVPVINSSFGESLCMLFAEGFVLHFNTLTGQMCLTM